MSFSRIQRVKLRCFALVQSYQAKPWYAKSRDSHLPLLQWKLFKNDARCFFNLNSFLTSWSCRKNDFTKVNFKIHDAITWTTTITIHILPNISRSKGNQTMKLGQVIEYNRNIFLQGSCRKWVRETNSRPLFVFLKKLYMR